MHSPAVGKNVGGYLYIHIDVVDNLPKEMGDALAHALQFVRDKTYNALKIKEDLTRITFLNYPDFFTEGFPELKSSWLVELATGEVKYRDYSRSLNPPILHRKETLIHESHKQFKEFAQLTKSAEEIQLFENSHLIGFKRGWLDRVRSKGYEVSGNALVPLANSVGTADPADIEGVGIQRHLTAMTRYGFSAPIQALARFGFLDGSKTLFDYGCGKGDDIRGLIDNDITAYGWDPYFKKDAPKQEADIVNLGFVINVIESRKERDDALIDAFSFANELLVVSAMIGGLSEGQHTNFSDGVVTSRNTFQKYYRQDELKNYLESILMQVAIPVSPGVFFVFKNDERAQNFSMERLRNRRRRLAHGSANRIRGSNRKSVVDRVFEENQEAVEAIWSHWVELGREPDKSELPSKALELNVRSMKPIMARLLSKIENSEAILEEARIARIEDLKVYFAMLQFSGRQKFRSLDPSLKRDIKIFFDDYETAFSSGKSLLFSISNIDSLLKASREASDEGLGFLDDDAFFFHSTVVDRLPSVLRAYVHCGLNLYGDLSAVDLVKIHLGSSKLSLMSYEDFETSPLPKLKQRIKLNLRTTDIDVFNYGGEFPAQYLYGKSKYINEEYPNYSEQIAFEEQLETYGLLNFDGFGPSIEVFEDSLRDCRLQIEDFKLVALRETPNLDDSCGEYFTFRDFIECGDTQARTRIKNLPQAPGSYNAYHALATNLIDPIVDYFGPIKLTYGFCSQELGKEIKGRVAPKLDQHAAYEKNRKGNYICDRLGAAVDFLVEDEDMLGVVEWIVNNLTFDRIYFYGSGRPIHVSYSATPTREVYELVSTKSGARVPRKLRFN